MEGENLERTGSKNLSSNHTIIRALWHSVFKYIYIYIFTTINHKITLMSKVSRRSIYLLEEVVKRFFSLVYFV